MAAAATTASGADADTDVDDFSRVHRAVAAGASEEELWRVIDECAQGDKQRRVQAVNQPGAHNKTPLQAAHRQKRCDLVGALVEAGADVRGIFEGKLTPLAACIAYGQADSVRALLRAGHDANEEIVWDPWSGLRDDKRVCFAAHLCLVPPPLGVPSDRDLYSKMIGAPQIGCLEVLLREGGADVNAPDWLGETPIFWLAHYGRICSEQEEKAARDLLLAAGARTSGVFSKHNLSPLMMAAENNPRFARFLIEEAGVPVNERSPGEGRTALHHCWTESEDPQTAALLLDAGAEIEARTKDGWTPLFASVCGERVATTRLLLERGASADVIDSLGQTPLSIACENSWWLEDERWPVFREILRRSSAETRRSERIIEPDEDETDQSEDESSAADLLTHHMTWGRSHNAPPSEADLRVQDRCRWAIAELLASGAPLRPENAAALLPIAASLSVEQHAKLAAWHAELRSWRAHETFVGLSFDVKELREAQREVEERRARVEALKRELRELGAGSETESSSVSSGSGSEESESDDKESESSSSSSSEESESNSEDETEGESREEEEGAGSDSDGGGESESETEGEATAPEKTLGGGGGGGAE